MTGEVLFLITAYSIGCDAPGPHTKAGTVPVAEFTVAADRSVLPLGSIVHIEGLGERMVHDIGGKVKGRHLDVYLSTCKEARRWKTGKRLVAILHVPRRPTPRLPATVIVRGRR